MAPIRKPILLNDANAIRRGLLVSLCAGLVGILSTPTIAQSLARAGPPVYVYEAAGCGGVALLARLRNFLNRREDGATDFVNFLSGWREAQGALNWGAGCWRGKVANLSIGLPMQVNAGGSLRDDETAQFKGFARTLVANGFDHAYVRIGWEFNGTWYRWSASPDLSPKDPDRPAQWVAAYRRDAIAVRSVCPKCRLVWNSALYRQGVEPSQVYPGDDVVDVVAVDAYNSPQITAPIAALNWAQLYGGIYDWGLAKVIAFAHAHHKPLAYPEWGTPTKTSGKELGDDGFYVSHMASLMADNTTAYQGWWDFNGGGVVSDVSRGGQPAASLAFQQAFGSGDLPAVLKGAELYTGTLKVSVEGHAMESLVARRPDGKLILLAWEGGDQPQPIHVRLSEARNVELIHPLDATHTSLGRVDAFDYAYRAGLVVATISPD